MFCLDGLSGNVWRSRALSLEPLTSSFWAGISSSLTQMLVSLIFEISCSPLAFPGPLVLLTFSLLDLVALPVACPSFCKWIRGWFQPQPIHWLDFSGFLGYISVVMTCKFPVKRHKCKNLTDFFFVLPPADNERKLRVWAYNHHSIY